MTTQLNSKLDTFADKSVLITGAGRGLGRELARGFAEEGAKVCVNYASSASEAHTLVSEIMESGGTAFAIQADIANSTAVNKMIETTVAQFGAIDILINNAGLSSGGPFLELSEENWDRVCGVNLKGPFLVSQAVARKMMKQKSGVIVNISATTTTYGRINAADYCSSKAGLNMLTKCMALELGPFIRVNGLGLGFVDSPLVHQVYSKEALENVIETTPLKRMTTFDETVAFVKLLASESTAFVTGQTIMFDGGRNMR